MVEPKPSRLSSLLSELLKEALALKFLKLYPHHQEIYRGYMGYCGYKEALALKFLEQYRHHRQVYLGYLRHYGYLDRDTYHYTYHEQSDEYQEIATHLSCFVDILPEIKRRLGKELLPYYEDALPYTTKGVARNLGRLLDGHKEIIANANTKDFNDTENIRERFVKWVLMILRDDCRDVWRKENRREIIEVSLSTLKEDELAVYSIEEPLTDMESREFRDYIEQENQVKQKNQVKRLRECYPKNYKNCNCYELVKRRILETPSQRWKDIAKELDVPLGTVTAHWQRKCVPLLKEMAKEFNPDWEFYKFISHL